MCHVIDDDDNEAARFSYFRLRKNHCSIQVFSLSQRQKHLTKDAFPLFKNSNEVSADPTLTLQTNNGLKYVKVNTGQMFCAKWHQVSLSLDIFIFRSWRDWIIVVFPKCGFKVEIPMLIVRNHAAVIAKHAVFVIPFFPNPKPAGKPRHLIQELAKLNI